MKKQYRIIEKWYHNTNYYEAQYSYPGWPFWFFINAEGSFDSAKRTIENYKNPIRDHKPKVVYVE